MFEGPTLYLVFSVIVIVLSAINLFILLLWTELKGKHDYDRENQIQCPSLNPDIAGLECKSSSHFLDKIWTFPDSMHCLLLFLLYGFLACHAGTARVALFQFLFSK